MSLELSSSAFADRDAIPKQYTADGADEPPPLSISGVPEDALSLALVIEDPDAPRKNFTHWVLYDIPPATRDLLSRGGANGINDFGNRGYGGPKPPSGRHRYVFKLYALDTKIDAKEPLDKHELQARMKGHVIEETELIGTYARAS